jgi:hypothetical protein
VEARFVISSSASRTIVKVQARICRIDDGRKWRLEEVRMVGLAGEGMRVGVISVASHKDKRSPTVRTEPQVPVDSVACTSGLGTKCARLG